MKLIHYWAHKSATDPDGWVNVTYWFLGVTWSKYPKLRFQRWRWDGLPRWSLQVGPLDFQLGRDHYWLDADEARNCLRHND